MTAEGRYCIATCYCGTCPHWAPYELTTQQKRRLFNYLQHPPRPHTPSWWADPLGQVAKKEEKVALGEYDPRSVVATTTIQPAPPVVPWYSQLPDEYERRGDIDGLTGEILQLIADDIETQPRNLQAAIGPSEVGSPCPRKVGYGLLEMPKVNPIAPPAWKAYVGTGVHSMLERALDRYNMNFEAHIGHAERFYVETELQVGELAGKPLLGHCDVYDRVTATVIDWKTNGPTMLKDHRANGPGPQYRSQIHLYGRGWARYLRLPVDRVMIVFLPRQGELSDSYIWHEPYDEQVALDALGRAEGIWTVLQTLGAERGLAALPAVEDFCGNCDWFVPGIADGNFLNGCPGQLAVTKPAPPLTLEGKPA